MRERDEIVAEIRRLIAEQLRGLQGQFSPEEARAYAARGEKLQELVNLLSSGNFRAS